MDDEQIPDLTGFIPMIKRVACQGNSLVLNVTKECRAVGIERGETVIVYIKRVEQK